MNKKHHGWLQAGFDELLKAAYPPNLPKDQADEMRTVFFGGAQHCFKILIDFLDPGEEPTDEDLMRCGYVKAELDEFINDYIMRKTPHEGSA